MNPRLRKILTAAAVALVFALTGCAAGSAADVPPAPPLVKPIVDQTKTLSPTQVDTLSTEINDGRTSKSRQVGILVVNRIPGGDLEGYSIKVARSWGVGDGKTNNGVFILVATDDHKLRLEVGTGLEGDIPDAVARRIGDNLMVPRMKQNDLNGALTAAVDAIYADAPAMAAGDTAASDSDRGAFNPMPIVIVVLIIIFICFAASSGGGGGTRANRRRSSAYGAGYYGSTSSSSSSSSSSSRSSFGGGGFSGGGSSSSW